MKRKVISIVSLLFIFSLFDSIVGSAAAKFTLKKLWKYNDPAQMPEKFLYYAEKDGISYYIFGDDTNAGKLVSFSPSG